jgi:hypothetical protein
VGYRIFIVHYCSPSPSPFHCAESIMKDEAIVGRALAEVMPQTTKYWFQTPHLLRLNLILLVPLLSSAVAGYDGMSSSLCLRDGY